MTLAQFTEIFALLAVQLRFGDADEATIRGYYKAMKGLEPELVALAAQRFAAGASVDDNGTAWFPKAPEWCAMAAKVEKERVAELAGVIRKRRFANQPLCNDCEDTCWRQNAATKRYERCQCADMRRLEVLGRRPMPQLPAGEPEGDPTQEPTALALAGKHVKGMR